MTIHPMLHYNCQLIRSRFFPICERLDLLDLIILDTYYKYRYNNGAEFNCSSPQQLIISGIIHGIIDNGIAGYDVNELLQDEIAYMFPAIMNQSRSKLKSYMLSMYQDPIVETDPDNTIGRVEWLTQFADIMDIPKIVSQRR